MLVTHRHRHTDTQTDTQTHRHRHTDRHTHTDTHTHRHGCRPLTVSSDLVETKSGSASTDVRYSVRDPGICLPWVTERQSEGPKRATVVWQALLSVRAPPCLGIRK